MKASEDLILEHALLVSRGVRPMALVAYVDLHDSDMLEAYDQLVQALGSNGAIPFVLPWREMDCAVAGFAAERWVIGMLEWMCSPDLVDPRRHHQLMGLLLGYSPGSIAEHDDVMFAGDPNARGSSDCRISPPRSS